LVFRRVPPGKGYRVRLAQGGQESAPVIVHGDNSAPWDPGVYDQSVPDSGYGYLMTRDGTTLAIDVRPPVTAGAQPPYPTLIEYSGYGYADPAGPDNGIALLARLMGFAVVESTCAAPAAPGERLTTSSRCRTSMATT
jgi:hypothetical protein